MGDETIFPSIFFAQIRVSEPEQTSIFFLFMTCASFIVDLVILINLVSIFNISSL